MEAMMHIGSVLLIVWLVIGGIAAGQRGDFNGSMGCSSASTIAVTVLAGPLNYTGVHPDIHCTVRHPSKLATPIPARPLIFPVRFIANGRFGLALLTCRHDHLRRRVRHRSGEDRRLRALRPAVDGAGRPARRPPPWLLPARRGRERQGAGLVQLPQ